MAGTRLNCLGGTGKVSLPGEAENRAPWSLEPFPHLFTRMIVMLMVTKIDGDDIPSQGKQGRSVSHGKIATKSRAT